MRTIFSLLVRAAVWCGSTVDCASWWMRAVELVLLWLFFVCVWCCCWFWFLGGLVVGGLFVWWCGWVVVVGVGGGFVGVWGGGLVGVWVWCGLFCVLVVGCVGGCVLVWVLFGF
ncbi:hypothetical protein, partial [Neisseria sp. P0016.S006]|uniref:hypothetical protein n=1 Tax=Neisseria sp. P0016.S006 TaxID=3436772 RepID=UPI003F7D45B3